MEPFRTLSSRVVPLPANDIDTDQIIPARYLKVTGKAGLAEGLFSEWRYFPDGRPRPDFPLNHPEYQAAQLLLAGDNFGCGSSREHAPWALAAWGIRAVISTSFADIFKNNAMKNGLLPVAVDPETHRRLFALVESSPAAVITIDLEAQTVAFPGGSAPFPIDPFNKLCLLNGTDQLGYILHHEASITAYEGAQRVGSL